MTKVREGAVVPPLDGARRARLARALDVPGVVAASLIGSQAAGTAGALSDVDVGSSPPCATSKTCGRLPRWSKR